MTTICQEPAIQNLLSNRNPTLQHPLDLNSVFFSVLTESKTFLESSVPEENKRMYQYLCCHIDPLNIFKGVIITSDISSPQNFRTTQTKSCNLSVSTTIELTRKTRAWTILTCLLLI